ncbi:hypothetical protein [Bradyrhizobium sp.]|uniref:hypothetical protein n=1 Tax=Bradyrhizobium sp. TaxID=376 RepID=UPI001E068046|nr:hypothetical protein [Bradyrhizobium sp.]MBV8701843.1 hypothetical protein [Bradyrhizobium sp.]MBV8922547.1 hypothetical protein [Bradyrhizobium sp.]MBV9981574.1 hypothetical protein [Bradyrhizobium sp.]
MSRLITSGTVLALAPTLFGVATLSTPASAAHLGAMPALPMIAPHVAMMPQAPVAIAARPVAMPAVVNNAGAPAPAASSHAPSGLAAARVIDRTAGANLKAAQAVDKTDDVKLKAAQASTRPMTPP